MTGVTSLPQTTIYLDLHLPSVEFGSPWVPPEELWEVWGGISGTLWGLGVCPLPLHFCKAFLVWGIVSRSGGQKQLLGCRGLESAAAAISPHQRQWRSSWCLQADGCQSQVFTRLAAPLLASPTVSQLLALPALCLQGPGFLLCTGPKVFAVRSSSLLGATPLLTSWS